MAGLRTGTVVHKGIVSETLIRFRLAPESGHPFPDYEAGQAIALSRDDCKLTRKTGVGPDGKPVREPEYDPWGRQTVGSLTHYYSIASAPSDTAAHGWLEFLVGLEHGVHGLSGRLSELLFGGEGDSMDMVALGKLIAREFNITFTLDDCTSLDNLTKVVAFVDSKAA